jgi:hypothetical protein
MSASSHFKELLGRLNEHQARYLIVGAYAVMKYTEPRYTKDLDIWVDATLDNARRVFKALAEFGAPMNSVTVEDFANPELVFQIGIEPHRIDVMMQIKGLEFSEAWSNRVEANFEDVAVALLSKKDLLTSKIAAGRPQDMIDIDRLKLSDEI